MGRQRDLLETTRQVDILRRVVDGIPTQHDQALDLPRQHLVNEQLEGRHSSSLLAARLFGERDRPAVILKQAIQPMHPRLNCGRQVRTGDQRPRTLVGHEVASQRVHDLGRVIRVAMHRLLRQFALHRRFQPRQERAHVARLHGQPMIGSRPDRREPRFDRVQTIHLARFRAATRRIATNQRQGRRVSGEQVGIQRDNDLRLGEVVLRTSHLAEGRLGTRQLLVAGNRVVLDPLRLGEHLLESRFEVGQSERRTPLGQDSQTRPLLLPLGIERRTQLGDRRVPRRILGSRACSLPHPHGPVRVVQVQHQRLRIGIRRSFAGDVFEVPFGLQRATIVTGHHHRSGDSTQFPRRRKLLRHTRNPVGRTAHERGNDLLFPATGEPPQRQRRPHQLQPTAPRHAVRKLGRRLGKLPLEHGFKLRVALQLAQAPPILRPGIAGDGSALARQR